jgi:hypothetical protein
MKLTFLQRVCPLSGWLQVPAPHGDARGQYRWERLSTMATQRGEVVEASASNRFWSALTALRFLRRIKDDSDRDA